jgi:hypothetical protein
MTTTAPQSSRPSLKRPFALSALGTALVAPVPLLAARPEWIPAILLERVGGAPALSWLLVLLMFALVGVAVLCASMLGEDR